MNSETGHKQGKNMDFKNMVRSLKYKLWSERKMYHFVVLINNNRNDEIRYVGTDIKEAVDVYELEKHGLYVDCWVEVWQGKNRLEKYWLPKQNDDEVFYKYIVNESMKDIWDNDKDAIYDSEE